MKKLKIYKESGEFVIEHINSFNHSDKRFYITEEGLFEGLTSYQSVIDEYEIQVSGELWSTVINFFNRGTTK